MDAASTSDTYRFGPFRLQARGGRLSRLDGHGNWVDFAIGSGRAPGIWGCAGQSGNFASVI